jgi:hypothetical protein
MRADFSLAVISDRLQAMTRAMDADPVQPARLKIYAAPVPAAGQPPDTAVLLATLAFPRPSLDNVTNKTLTLLNPSTTLVSTTGEAGWARIENGAGQYVVDLDVGVAGSGAAVILNNGTPDSLMLYAGGELSVTLAKLQEP